MRRIIAALALTALATLGAAPAQAYPGSDGYDSGYCWADGIKMGVSNYFSGTGQIVAIDADDESGYASFSRVVWSSSISTFTATTSLARKEIYRASRTEAPRLRLYTSLGTSCSLVLDGSM
jgi:hypothetical protein